MASGSSGRANLSGSKAFDFGSDDILCSYEDYATQDGNNGIHSDAREFNKSRSSVFPGPSYDEGVISTVENTVKKYTDNLMRFLEGISSRLSQLELYCYKLDRSIGEMRSDLSRDHVESESRLISLEKHVQEVHRSVQILRDKQELADTHKELAKLQLEHKDSSLPSSNDKKGNENPSDEHNQQQHLALQVVPHQTSMAPPQSMAAAYYSPQTNNSNITHPSQPQYLPAPSQTQTPQQVVSSYQQQWTVQTQTPSHHQQVRTSSQMGVPFSYPSAEIAPKPGSEGMRYGYIQQPNHPKDYGPLPHGNSNAYTAFDSEGGRTFTAHHRLPYFQHQNAYPPHQMQTNVSSNMGVPPQSSMRQHLHSELIDRLVSTGYRVDHVVAVIRRLEESGQSIDFNSVLDVLNGHSHSGGSGVSRRGGWAA